MVKKIICQVAICNTLIKAKVISETKAEPKSSASYSEFTDRLVEKCTILVPQE